MKRYIKYQFSKLRGNIIFIIMLSFLLCFYLAASFRPLTEDGSNLIKQFIEGNRLVSKLLCVKFFISPMDRLVSLEYCLMLPLFLIEFILYSKHRLHSKVNSSGEIAWFRLVPVKKSSFLLSDFFVVFIGLFVLNALIFSFNYLLSIFFEAWSINVMNLLRLSAASVLLYSLPAFLTLFIDYAFEKSQNARLSVFALVLIILMIFLFRIADFSLIDFLDPNTLAISAAAFYKASFVSVLGLSLLSLISLACFNR